MRKQKKRKGVNWQKLGYKSYSHYLQVTGLLNDARNEVSRRDAKELERSCQVKEASDREKYHNLRLWYVSNTDGSVN